MLPVSFLMLVVATTVRAPQRDPLILSTNKSVLPLAPFRPLDPGSAGVHRSEGG